MVGERVAFVVAPENFLGDEIVHPALRQQLRQRGRIAEGIRQPENAAVDAELLLKEPLAEHELPHERFAGGDVRVRFDIPRAFGDPAARLRGLADAGVQLGIMVAAHLIGGGLALDKAVAGVALQQAQLRGKGARGLAVGLLHRPQPGQVQVGVAHGGHARRGGAVAAGQQRAQRFARGAVAFIPRGGRLFKIDQAGVFLQPVGDFGRAQRILRQLVHQLRKGRNVHPQLVGVLVPHAERAAAKAGARPARGGVAQRAGQNGPRAAAAHIGEIVPGVGFKQQVERLAARGAAGQHIVADIVVRHADPLGPAGAEGFAVHNQRRLAAKVQVHRHGLPAHRLGQRQAGAAPQVLPGPAPRRAGRKRRKRAACRLLRRQVFHGRERFKFDLAHRAVQVAGQHALPVGQAVPVF